MRLTIDVIMQAPQYLCPSKNWTLNLRACKIDLIENLGATADNFECIDFSDNELIKLSNFPPLSRLNTLILCNNRISRISEDIGGCLPNLKSLILTNNKLDQLVDLEPLFEAKKLERLSLCENPVCELPYYRLFIIYNIPSVRFLDFKRVREEERMQANKTFKGENGNKLLNEIAPPRSKPSASDGAGVAKAAANTLGQEQIESIKSAIAKATTIEEITKLENALRAGKIPENTENKGATDVEMEDAEK